jgi:hypothetical protein
MKDDDLDNLLRSHLAGQLDRQRGRAQLAFERQVVAPLQRKEEAESERYRIGPARRWGVIALAMAACLALGVALPTFLNRDDSRQIVESDPTPPQREPIDVQMAGLERTTYLRNVDHGPVILEQGSPARRIRQQRVDRYRWTDPRTNAQYEYTTPSEQELLIEMHRQ